MPRETLRSQAGNFLDASRNRENAKAQKREVQIKLLTIIDSKAVSVTGFNVSVRLATISGACSLVKSLRDELTFVFVPQPFF